MMPSNNNYAAWVYGSLQRNAARFCSTERLQTQILCGGMLWPNSVVREQLRTAQAAVQARCNYPRFIEV